MQIYDCEIGDVKCLSVYFQTIPKMTTKLINYKQAYYTKDHF